MNKKGRSLGTGVEQDRWISPLCLEHPSPQSAPQTSEIKENLCSEVQSAYSFCSTCQWKRNHSCYLFDCTSIFIWDKLCWFFSIFLFVISFALQNSGKKKSLKHHFTSLFLILGGRLIDRVLWCLCSVFPFPFFFSVFVCLLLLPNPCFHKYLPLGI